MFLIIRKWNAKYKNKNLWYWQNYQKHNTLPISNWNTLVIRWVQSAHVAPKARQTLTILFIWLQQEICVCSVYVLLMCMYVWYSNCFYSLKILKYISMFPFNTSPMHLEVKSLRRNLQCQFPRANCFLGWLQDWHFFTLRMNNDYHGLHRCKNTKTFSSQLTWNTSS